MLQSAAPQVAVRGGTVYVRWADDEPWTTVERRGGLVQLGDARDLPGSASRLADLGWELRGVRPGDIYPVGGVAGDCPVRWQVWPGLDESWWCCTLPAGHQYGANPLPHVAASYSRVDAVLDADEAARAMRERSPMVRLSVA